MDNEEMELEIDIDSIVEMLSDITEAEGIEVTDKTRENDREFTERMLNRSEPFVRLFINSLIDDWEKFYGPSKHKRMKKKQYGSGVVSDWIHHHPYLSAGLGLGLGAGLIGVAQYDVSRQEQPINPFENYGSHQTRGFSDENFNPLERRRPQYGGGVVSDWIKEHKTGLGIGLGAGLFTASVLGGLYASRPLGDNQFYIYDNGYPEVISKF